MLIRILAIGNKMPKWVEEGFQEYAKRLPFVKLHEIPAEKRAKNSDIPRIKLREGENLLQMSKPGNRVIALDVNGQSWSTEQLATQYANWLNEGRDLDIFIGGPDGLSTACLQKAEIKWSLSPLTLPHPLVRIVLAEQLYRAASILQNHPYHR